MVWEVSPRAGAGVGDCVLWERARGLPRSRSAVAVVFFSSRRRHTRLQGDWSSDVCSSDLPRGFVLDVRQSFGNCPQYIQPRDFRTASAGSRPPETLQRLAGSDGDHLGWSGGARLPRSRAPLALSRPSGLAQARRAPLALDLSRARRIGNLARLLLLARDLRRGAQTRPARCAAWSAAAVFPMRVSHPKEFVVSRPRGALDAAIDRLVKREVALHNGVVHCRRETGL